MGMSDEESGDKKEDYSLLFLSTALNLAWIVSDETKNKIA
jgi:hypothetical protein